MHNKRNSPRHPAASNCARGRAFNGGLTMTFEDRLAEAMALLDQAEAANNRGDLRAAVDLLGPVFVALGQIVSEPDAAEREPFSYSHWGMFA